MLTLGILQRGDLSPNFPPVFKRVHSINEASYGKSGR